MNLQKLIFNSIAFIFIINAQIVYTKAQEDDNKNSQSAMIQDQPDTIQENAQFNEEMWKFTEETFQTVTDQAQQIEFCLQTIEQIINAGKLQFNNQQISKTQLLQEIKYIKQHVQQICEYFTKNFQKYESIGIITCYNTVFIDYLLPIFQNNIMTINAEKFDTYQEQNIERIAAQLENTEQLSAMIQANQLKLEQLMKAGDLAGLSTFNKFYRFLESKPLPITGVPALTTLGNVAYWGGIGLLAYGTATFIAPANFKIPFLNCDIPFKNWIGSLDRVETFDKAPLGEEKAKAAADFKVVDGIEVAMRAATNSRVVVTAIGILTVAVVAKWKEIRKAAEEQWIKSLNYLRGDSSIQKNSTEVPKTYFKDMIGGEDLEKLARELADYLKHPTRYERAGITPSTGYLLTGPSQTGKSFFAKALNTLIDEEFEGSNEKIKFWSITADDVEYYNGFANIFYIASKHSPMILFIDEIDMHGARRDTARKSTQDLLTSMNGVETDPTKKVIVIAATNKPEELDFALKQKGRLGTVITFDYPTYECRKAYLEKELIKKNINLNPEMIDTIAQETDGQTYNMLNDIIRQALQLSTFQTRPVEESDFEITLDREIRKIKPNIKMSTHEQELIAIYQAGQAVARHTLKTEQQIVKITINAVDKAIKSKEGFGVVNEQKGEMHENYELLPPTRIKQTRLGFVFTMSKTNNHELVSDEDQEKELMALLAGQAALELIKGQTFNGFGKEDRAKVIEALEKKISQGTPITDKIRQQALAAKDILYQKAKAALQNHVAFIQLITDELIKNHTINTKQWLTLAKNYKI